MSKKILISFVSMLALAAFAAAPALATKVTPAETAFTAKLVTATESTFTTENGTGLTVSCSASSTGGTTPSKVLPVSGPPFYNENPSNAVPSKLAGGSVLANLTTPTFGTCKTAVPTVTAAVATSANNGKWSIDWNTLNSAATPWRTAAIGVPKAGATITLTAEGNVCELVVDPETAQGVIGYWKNGTATTGSELFINEQVFYAPTTATEAVCTALGATVADSPAVFRAAYTIQDAAGAGIIEEY